MCIFAVFTGAKGFADPDSAWNGGVFSKQTWHNWLQDWCRQSDTPLTVPKVSLVSVTCTSLWKFMEVILKLNVEQEKLDTEIQYSLCTMTQCDWDLCKKYIDSGTAP